MVDLSVLSGLTNKQKLSKTFRKSGELLLKTTLKDHKKAKHKEMTKDFSTALYTVWEELDSKSSVTTFSILKGTPCNTELQMMLGCFRKANSRYSRRSTSYR